MFTAIKCVRVLRGVIVRSSRDVRFGIEDCKASVTVDITETIDINEKDFKVTYNKKALIRKPTGGQSRGSGMETRDRSGFRTLSQSTRCFV